MNIQQTYSVSFQGIRLSNPKFEQVRDMALYLQRVGFYNLGHKTKYCNNTMNAKIQAVKSIRQQTNFQDREFGALFLPWSHEAYIIASPVYEQTLYRVIKQYDKGAQLNMAI